MKKININELSIEEMQALAQSLSPAKLCVPITQNAKHFQKQIKGFRLNALPPHMIAKIYFDEIKGNDNYKLKEVLAAEITTYFKQKKIDKIIEKMCRTDVQLNKEEWYNCTLELVEHECQISLRIIFKLFSLKIEELFQDINSVFSILSSQKQKNNIALQSRENEFKSECKKQIDHITDELQVAKSNLHHLQNEIKEHTKNNKKLCDTLNKLERKVNEQTSANMDLACKNNSLNNDMKLLKKFEVEAKFLNQKVLTLLDQIQLMSQENSNLEGKLYELQQQDKHILSEDLRRLCFEVSEDLANKYTMSELLNSNWLSNIPAEQDVFTTWTIISKDEDEFMEKIITKMKVDDIGDEDINLLDNVENDLVIKYIIVKAMKALFFEYLGQLQASENIADKFSERK